MISLIFRIKVSFEGDATRQDRKEHGGKYQLLVVFWPLGWIPFIISLLKEIKDPVTGTVMMVIINQKL